MEKLFTSKLHIGIEEPHTLCGGALESLADDIKCEIQKHLQAVADLIRGKFSDADGVHHNGGEGKIKVVVEV